MERKGRIVMPAEWPTATRPGGSQAGALSPTHSSTRSPGTDSPANRSGMLRGPTDAPYDPVYLQGLSIVFRSHYLCICSGRGQKIRTHQQRMEVCECINSKDLLMFHRREERTLGRAQLAHCKLLMVLEDDSSTPAAIRVASH
jgi:hypothetical protein